MSPAFDFPVPVLSLAADAIRELEGRDAVCGLLGCESLFFQVEKVLSMARSVLEMQGVHQGRSSSREHLMAIVASRAGLGPI